MSNDHPRYSEQLRTATVEALRLYAAQKDQILAMVMVGSGATSFKDQYSDVDIIFVVRDQAAVEAMHADYIQWANKNFHTVFNTIYQHQPDVYVLSQLLPNLLELDIGFWSLTKLYATRPSWKIIQCHDPHVQELVTSALNNAQPTFEQTGKPVIEGDDSLWQFINGWIVARLRKDELATQQTTQALQNHIGKTDNAALLDAARAHYTNAAQLQLIEQLIS